MPRPCWSVSKKIVGNWSMPLHKLPIITTVNVQEMQFSHMNFKQSPYRGRGEATPSPLLGRFAPWLWPSVDKSWLYFKKGGVGDWYMSLHITYPLMLAFNVQENAVFIHESPLPSKKSPNRSVASLPHFDPPPPPPVDKSWLHHCH